MKLVSMMNPKLLSPKRLFKSIKKDRSFVSRHDPSSFSSTTTDSSASDTYLSNHKPISRGGVENIGTPTSVLPDMSGDWSDFSPAEILLELQQTFKLTDRDDDVVVSSNQLAQLLTRLGPKPPSEEEVACMLREVDEDGDGVIRVADLMNRLGSVCEPACDDDLRVAFEFFDSDRDGKITAEELHGVFTAIGDERVTLEECKRMIAEVDKNGDGFVCFEDFSRMMELQR